MEAPEVLLRMQDKLRRVSWELREDYHTVPVDELLNSDVAVCWDFVNWQHHELSKLGIENHSYLIIYDIDNGESLSHTWSTVIIDNQLWWFENSWGGHEGIYPIDSYDEVADRLIETYPPTSQVLLYEYNPDGLDDRLSPEEFIMSIKRSGKRIIRSKNAE